MTTDTLLTPPEAAARMRLAKQTLARWRCEGGGPRYVRLSGNRVAYRAADIDAWLEARIMRHTSERSGA